MISKDSFNSTCTNVEVVLLSFTLLDLSCVPEDTSGIERIMLAAQGDLQRLLSSFFARPIFIELVYANGSPRVRTGIVRASYNPVTADDKYPIGQTFRMMQRNARFALLDVQTQVVSGKRELSRMYTLETEGFLCEILEVFPDRDMFVRGEAWFTESKLELENSCAVASQDIKPPWLPVSKGSTVH
ncbi:hypothetical protein DFH29DRAFT_1044739 [Suillus ampliporus]|nr:hypothetical protein DFH29DRAFT_1044739 [Suillus ampliporus]